MSDTTHSLKHHWILGIGVLGAVCVQLLTIQGTWYLDSDDWFIIDMGRQVASAPSWEQVTRIWTEEPTWRPLLTLRTALEFAAFGDAIEPRLLVNLSLHVLCAVLLFLTVRAWFGRPRAAAWAAVLFAVHPLHAEALTWFHSGFEGITPTVFSLLTIWLFVTRRPLVLGLIAFQLALFTRENTVILPALLALAAAARAERGRRLALSFADSAPYWALLVANVAGRLVLLHLAGGDGSSDFHLVDNPVQALLTTIVHPWIPVHPALPARTVWWVAFGLIPITLAWLQRDHDRRELVAAAVAFIVASLPFLPVFHASHRFFEALPGGYEQRWYFFHLPLAFLMVWPAYLLVEFGHRRTGWAPIALAALAGLMLTAQAFNARWYREQGVIAAQVTGVVNSALAEGAPAVGIVISAGSDGAELADQVLLNLPRIWPAHANRGVRSFHLYREPGEDVPRLEQSAPGRFGHRHWSAVKDLPPNVRWWVYDDAQGVGEAAMTPILPRDLELPPGAVLPSCCAH